MKSSDPLARLFAAWKHDEPPSVPSVATEVRHRLSELEAKRDRSSWVVRIEAVFSRPSFAAVFVSACVVLGLFLAEVQLSHRENERMARVEQSYLRLIDPLIIDSALEAVNPSP